MKTKSTSLAFGFVVMLSTPVLAQDETLAECRGLGVEQLLQSFVLSDDQKVFTANLIAFCDDYGALKREAADLQQIVERQSANITEISLSLETATDAIATFRGQLGQIADQLNAANKRLPPDGSILLVDNPGKCPAGWVDMAAEEPTFFAGRSIIAVGSAEGRSLYEYRGRGGFETHTLTEAQMPKHKHDIGVIALSVDGRKIDVTEPEAGKYTHMPYFADGASAIQEGRSNAVIYENGGSVPHNNMPPYIALYFCKKEG